MSNTASIPPSPKTGSTPIRIRPLRQAVSRMLGVPVSHIAFEAAPLHGGTLGDVQRVTGEAATADGQTLPFRLVCKTQKRWQRPGDPLSWRREYDLYQSALSALFTPGFRAPAVYAAELGESGNQLWMEYVEGSSGARLTPDDLRRAALALGRFQGRCRQQEAALRQIACLGDAGYLQRDFAQWSPDTVEYRYLRSDRCALPQPLKQLLIRTQEQSETIFVALQALPQVLCHRDYWSENIFAQPDGIVAIDWDCAGFGVIGEDIASLVADETDPAQIVAYARLLMPAYYQGLNETMALPPMNAVPLRELIIMKFGYRFLQQAMFAKSPAQTAQAISALSQIAALP